MLDKAMITIVCSLLMIVVIVGMLGIVTEILRKFEFDRICRFALYEIDLEGGLSEATRENLENRLQDAGFVDINIQAPETVQYGERINFCVGAEIPVRRWMSLFEFEERNVYFTYEREIVSRKIHNAAF